MYYVSSTSSSIYNNNSYTIYIDIYGERIYNTVITTITEVNIPNKGVN